MTIQIKKEHYYIGIWYVSWNEGNYLGCAWKNEKGNYEGTYRFRYYKHSADSPLYSQDDPMFEDIKNWYNVKINTSDPPTEQGKRIREVMEVAADKVAKANDCEKIYAPIEGDGNKAYDVFVEAPWARIIPKEEGTIH